MSTPLPTWTTVTAAADHAARTESVLTHGTARAIAAHRALTTSALDRTGTDTGSARAVAVFLLTGEVPDTVGAIFSALYTDDEYDALSAVDRFVADMFDNYLTARVNRIGTMDRRPLVGWGDGMALTR